jgi:hypothetical protein
MRLYLERNQFRMTNQECFNLFSEAIKKKRIVRYENSNNRDDYFIHAIRETPDEYVFFCLIKTFFRSGHNTDTWKTGFLSSYHEFSLIKGAATDTLYLTNESFSPAADYKDKLPVLGFGESKWKTID